MMHDAYAIRYVRTEQGKRMRKDYEAGLVKHGFREFCDAELKIDGLANTITTVQKDLLILAAK